MKRNYVVRAERNNNWQSYHFNVVATSAEQAAIKAKRVAQADSGVKSGWRITSAIEQPGFLIP